MNAEDRPMRADARRNRVRVLRAAETVLAREGLGASMRSIAQEAGVGLGTIYRNFPTQEALYEAIIVERVQRLIDHAATLREAVDADAGDAFFGFFTEIVANSTRQRALADVLVEAGIDIKAGMSETGKAMREAVEALLARAQRAGAVREDLRMPELLALLSATCMAAERNQWDDALRARALGLLFDGFRPQRPEGWAPPPKPDRAR
ncbi:TetR/AcrR family transcriptional regulator [Streptomyces sp. NPDC015661]|uniref:TetR/AcrR family transcriptional regulator n=1 Tax=Streptomyces sp. NPDC015661 TaxID=3364961 RepID=UPI0036FC88D2